jgi:hypothetical protein
MSQRPLELEEDASQQILNLDTVILFIFESLTHREQVTETIAFFWITCEQTTSAGGREAGGAISWGGRFGEWLLQCECGGKKTIIEYLYEIFKL